MSLELGLFTFLVASVVALLLIAAHYLCTIDRVVPSNLPWVGVKSEYFAIFKAHLRDWTQAQRNLKEGYLKVT
jgi:hypothetical protein